MNDITSPIVPNEDVRELLDIIACSMDFGSGFLDTEQVVLLRRVAAMVGIDPKALTPRNMPHSFVPMEHAPECCAWCHCWQNKPVHTDPWPFTDEWKVPEE